MECEVHADMYYSNIQPASSSTARPRTLGGMKTAPACTEAALTTSLFIHACYPFIVPSKQGSKPSKHCDDRCTELVQIVVKE